MKKTMIATAFSLLCGAAVSQTIPNLRQPPMEKLTQKAMYRDVKSGKAIELRYDTATSGMVDRSSDKPVDFFINNGGDTITTHGFYVVNNYLTMKNNEYAIDSTKTTMRGRKMWATKSGKELEMDYNRQRYTEVEKMKEDTTQ